MTKLTKFENIEIIYITPKKQLWGIFNDGVKKKCVIKKMIDITCLSGFIQSKKLISYKDSKLFKKGIKIKFVLEGVQLIRKNVSFIVKILNNEHLLDNSKKTIVETRTKIKKNQCLGFTKTGLQCSRLILGNYCFQHKKLISYKNNQLFYNKSPLRYPGGKTRACKILYEILDRYLDLKNLKYIVSPFFGGGSFEFFLSNKYGYKVFANDIYYYLSNFWSVCKTNKKELCTLLQASLDIDKEIFTRYKKNLKFTNHKILQAYYFFILNRCSFNGIIDSGGFSKLAAKDRFTESSINSILNLNLSKFVISNHDFEIFLKANNKKNSLIFLDPPYFSNKKSKLYGDSGDLHTNFDHIRLFKYISTKYNWIMTYDNCSFIKNLYKDFEQIEVSWTYGMANSRTELVILGKKNGDETIKKRITI